MMKKNIPKLPASELKIMKVLWKGHAEMSRLEIEAEIKEEERLAPTTVNTLLSRLEERSFISVKKQGKTNYYTPIVSKKEYQRRESHSIIDNLFDGSLAEFVTSLYDGKKIPEEKVAELEDFIQSFEDEL